ncbi:MAG: polysaccharide deacetylase family protein [Syntrophales bacterium]|nr:polysaccharide deacetylase family protein [Syntrophales bacterium]
MNTRNIRYVPPAMVAGGAAILLALLLSFIRMEWAALPLAAFVLTCLAAPFYYTRGFFLPIISRGKTGKSMVSVTFDDGPDPLTTGPLLQLLAHHSVKAAFFVTGENADRYGDLISEILKDGHKIGNHSYSHDPFLMLRSSRTLDREIASMQDVLRRFGVAPTVFRPPVGITNPRLMDILCRQGLSCVTFSCRANDFGNRRISGLADKILAKVKADDIILLHDIRPKGGARVEDWLHEVDLILMGIKNLGLQAAPLAELIEKPVMIGIDVH